MLFHTLNDFTAIWHAETANNDKLFRTLNDAILDEEILPPFRSLARLAWHILETPAEMLGRTGLQVASCRDDHPSSVEDIVEENQRIGDSVVIQVQSHWTDASLLQEDEMYGEKWTRSRTLAVLLFHMIHHRGQMTVLMRGKKVKVPGIYGPSREEWAALGLAPPL